MAAPEHRFYVSNKQMYEDYVQWYADIEKAVAEGKPEPPIPPYIIESIMKICTKALM